MGNKLSAIVWDYDGTIADTSDKNYKVSFRILNEISNGNAENYAPLKSPEELYLANQRTGNWRDLYRKEFGIDEELIDSVGGMWTEYQLMDNTDVKLFAGIQNILDEQNDILHAIVSQNSQSSIKRFLSQKNLAGYFKAVYGYEQVDITNQKPHPEGLLKCLREDLKINSGIVLYIGDHTSDFLLVENANYELSKNGEGITLKSVGVKHFSETDKYWKVKPDYAVDNIGQISEIVNNIKNRNDNDN